MDIGVLILAAGKSSRFGADKRMAMLGDTHMLCATVSASLSSGLPVAVVVRENDSEISVILNGLGARVLMVAPEGGGLGDSLAAGIKSMTWSGVMVALGDMPWVKPSTYVSIADAMTDEHIVRPVYDSKAGHPVGFGNAFLPNLRGLSGDPGAREILSSRQDAIKLLKVDDPGVLIDIDLPSDITT